MSPFGSIASAGIPSRAASSSSVRHRPVLPLPVIPRATACVVRSRASYIQGGDASFAAIRPR